MTRIPSIVGRGIDVATVLHIDGDWNRAERTRRALSAAGHACVSVAGAMEALDVGRKTRWDAAVVAQVADFDVHGLVMRLQATEPTGRPVVVLGDAAETAREAALAVGAAGYADVAAPATVLVEQIGRCLAGERAFASLGSEVRLRDVGTRIAEHLEEKARRLAAAEYALLTHERRRAEYLQNVSHELATPLTPLVGYVQLLRSESLGPLNPEQRRVLEALAGSLTKLESTTSLLQEVSAFERGEVSVNYVRTDMATLAAAIAVRHAKDARVKVAPCQPIPILVDERLLGRAIDKVIENATKFGGPTAVVQVSFESDAHEARVTVRDDGPGVSPVEARRISDVFHQADGRATRRHGGLGLGLAYVRHVMEAHEGVLRIAPNEPEHGSGTTVVLAWPRVR